MKRVLSQSQHGNANDSQDSQTVKATCEVAHWMPRSLLEVEVM